MKIRDVYLLNLQTLKDADTVQIPLPKTLKILFLRVQYSNQNGATSNTVGRLNGMVSNLAVTDGSTVLYGASMREVQALNFHTNKRMPFQQLSQAGGATVMEEAIIDFRRYEGDTSFYMDTSAYTNPQIQLTHSFTVSATAGFATGDGKLTVIARVIDSGAPARMGQMMVKELDSFSSTSSGDHNTDLPLDFPISSLLVVNPVDANTADHYLSNFKLTADTDSFIPVNESVLDLLRRNFDDEPAGYQQMDALNGTTYTMLGDFYFRTQGSVSQAGATAKALATVQTGNQTAGVGTTGESGTVTFEFDGWAPHGSMIYKFGDGIDPNSIFNPAGVGKFQLKLTNANTGATPKVVTVQQRS